MGTGGNNPKDAWSKIATKFANAINMGLESYNSATGYVFGANINGPEKVPVLRQFDKGQFLVYIDNVEYIITIKPKNMK